MRGWSDGEIILNIQWAALKLGMVRQQQRSIQTIVINHITRLRGLIQLPLLSGVFGDNVVPVSGG